MNEKKGKKCFDPKVSIILPTYNESENIGFLIDEISELLKNKNYEIIVVDDDSPDGTINIVEEKSKHNKRIRSLLRIDERGLTSALNHGIANARGEILVWMDCDLQMPTTLISELIFKVENGYDAAIGSRFIKGGGDIRHLNKSNRKIITKIHRHLSKLICKLTSIVLNTDFSDWTSGFIAIRKDIFNSFNLIGDHGEYFMYLAHHLIKSDYRVLEVPYVLKPRVRGKSKTAEGYFSMIIMGIRYLFALVKLKLFNK